MDEDYIFIVTVVQQYSFHLVSINFFQSACIVPHHGSKSAFISFNFQLHLSAAVNQGFHGGNTWGKITWVYLFIKYLGICHEEPLSIIHFHFLYNILCPSISILAHSILTLHYSRTSKSSPSLHLLHQSIRICLVASTQEPAVRNDALLPHKNSEEK